MPLDEACLELLVVSLEASFESPVTSDLESNLSGASSLFVFLAERF
jgi:hypothetical protein